MKDKNLFGGGNVNALYTPMSEDEQEVLHRLIEADDLEIHVREWGIVKKFLEKPRFGDKRLQLKFVLDLQEPVVHIPVHYLDLELRTRAGRFLYGERHAVKDPQTQGPLMLGRGVFVPMAWDIAIHKMSPKLVKEIKPGAIGLTTREGNRKLTEQEQTILQEVRKGEKRIRDENKRAAAEATKKSLY